MPSFILDTCTDVIEGQKEHISQFFRDIERLNGYYLVTGGKKMKSEIIRKEALLNLINRLRSVGRVESFCDELVDAKQDEIELRLEKKLYCIPSECDDLHLLSLSLVSDCTNIVSKDTRLRRCVDAIRESVGHDYCPSIRLIQSEKTYAELKKKNLL